MPITHEVDRARNIRIHRASGELTFDELSEELRRIYDSDGFQPDQSSLWDLREADVTSFTKEQIASIVEIVRDRWATQGTARSALVVAREVAFGLARMYELQLDAQPADRVRVFYDYEEAESWLQEPR
jgi:hypothetical protein